MIFEMLLCDGKAVKMSQTVRNVIYVSFTMRQVFGGHDGISIFAIRKKYTMKVSERNNGRKYAVS